MHFSLVSLCSHFLLSLVLIKFLLSYFILSFITSFILLCYFLCGCLRDCNACFYITSDHFQITIYCFIVNSGILQNFLRLCWYSFHGSIYYNYVIHYCSYYFEWTCVFNQLRIEKYFTFKFLLQHSSAM